MPDETVTGSHLYPFSVVGEIVKGFGRGSSELGIPTANIEPEVVKDVPLSTGVYFGWSQLTIGKDQFNQLSKDQRDSLEPILQLRDPVLVSPVYMMSTSLGYNPQYNNKEKALEVHILNQFNCNLYGITIRSLICGKIRDEASFESIEALIKAIKRDIEETKQLLSTDPWPQLKMDNKYFIQ